jgi:hypothetical protein
VTHPSSQSIDRPGAADLAAELLIEVSHGLARHAVEDVSPDEALLLAIECVIEAANLTHSNKPLTALELSPFDKELFEPLIRRGQSKRGWSQVPTTGQLALSLRSLIAGLLPLSGRYRQEPRSLAHKIHTLFLEAAANAS